MRRPRDPDQGFLGGWLGYAAAAAYARVSGWQRARALAGPRVRPSLPVIAVGNLTAGGTGKTPFTAWAAGVLLARDIPVSIVCRDVGPRTPAGTGDEPTLLAELVPGARVHSGRSKAELAARAAADLITAHQGREDPEPAHPAGVVLVDDAFSHLALVRDLDIVLVDATRPIGNGHLLPRGPLREPPTALARAHAVIASRADRLPRELLANVLAALQALAPRALVASGRHRLAGVAGHGGLGPVMPAPAGQRVVCLSGLARPGELARSAAEMGLEVVADFSYPDHHRFRPREWRRARAAANRAGAWLLVSRKDACRLDRPRRITTHVLEIGWEPMDAGSELLARIEAAARGPLAAA